MKYLCLVYHEEAKLGELSASERDALVAELLEHCEELRRCGHYVASAPLQPRQTGATIRVRHGRLSVAEGPLAEAREQLSAFYLIDARDLNEAIRLAAGIPLARLGCIEVRPILALEQREPPARPCAQ